jgi:hypothetical protein
MRPTICSLFEPHDKQNLYTNPKRTAKSSIAFYLIDTSDQVSVQKTPLIFNEPILRFRRNAGDKSGNIFH